MIIRQVGIVAVGQPATVKIASVKEVFKHKSPKCQGCPYGNRQYCVGICWKDAYDSVLNKKKKNGAENR